jgi:hypothetical protein
MKGTVLVFISMLFLISFSAGQARAAESEKIFKDIEIKSSPGVSLSPEDLHMLEKRVKTYWDARMDGNAGKMYELEDPDVIKDNNLTLSGYIRSKSPAIVDKGYEVKGIEIVNQKKARVFIVLTAFINLPQVMKEENAVIKDIWQKKQGQWYRWLVLNPFGVLNESDRKKIEAKPYEGPLGTDLLKGDKKTEKPPSGQEIPGEGLDKEKAGKMPESGTKVEIAPSKLGGVDVRKDAPVQKETPGKDSSNDSTKDSKEGQ